MPVKSAPPLRWFNPPSWLARLDNLDLIPLRPLLQYSLFYPASACDGAPIRLLRGYIHSFVQAESFMSKAEVLGHLEEQHDGFHGYGLRMLREVKLEEILPDNWQPTLPTVRDGDPAKFRSLMPESFALWAIYERMPNLDDFHGPNRFSVLHICGDGVATYEALYNAQRVQPDVIAIIGAGTESGQNWTDFRDDQQILARVAFQNKGGKPRYLLQEHCESGSY